MHDFWLTSGYHLLERNAEGWLVITDAFLRAYFRRPEIAPEAASSPAEHALYARLLANPRIPLAKQELMAIEDPDLRENYGILLRFRDRLLVAGTVEGCYLSVFRGGARADLPVLFAEQMAHVILRNILEGCEDPLRLRAAELLFRPQQVETRDGAILLADEEVVQMRLAASVGTAGPSALTAATIARPAIELDILDRENEDAYWERSDRFDTVLDLSFAKPGLDALCRVLSAWVRHFRRVEVGIQPVQAIRDERWRWHVGLDAESSALLNDLYEGRPVPEERLARLLSLFRLEFADPAVVLPDTAGRPVYLGLAMTPDRRVRLKPQNLLVNLPLRTPE
jgi:hypothetical protein